MGWGSCEPPELPDEALAVKAGETGEAIGLRPMVVHGVDIRWSSGAVDVHSYVVKERLLRELRKERWRRMQECLTRFFD